VSPDNAILASASTDCFVVVWRLADGFPLTALKHDAPINWLRFDPITGAQVHAAAEQASLCHACWTGALASVADDSCCKVWDLANILQEHVSTLPLLDLAGNDDVSSRLGKYYAQYGKLANIVRCSTNVVDKSVGSHTSWNLFTPLDGPINTSQPSNETG
jgi:WD40 repeat protein